MKYITEDVMVGFREIPGEISLLINITGCTVHCPGCHSKYLWEDKGDELTGEVLADLINRNPGITCVSFQGGFNTDALNDLARVCRASHLRTAWWTGMARSTVFRETDDPGRMDGFKGSLDPVLWDYIKVGPYDERYGGLDSSGTNQRMYAVTEVLPGGSFTVDDITHKYWKTA